MSFGWTQGAAETLARLHPGNNPRQAVKPWLKLLDVHHVAGMRGEFEALDPSAQQDLNEDGELERLQGRAPAPADTVEKMPHITQRLRELWGTVQEAQAYIHQILRDNRNGTREGFPSAWRRGAGCCCSPSWTASSAPTNHPPSQPWSPRRKRQLQPSPLDFSPRKPQQTGGRSNRVFAPRQTQPRHQNPGPDDERSAPAPHNRSLAWWPIAR